MPIATSSKPRVLFINEFSGDASADAAIREIADVYFIQGLNYEESIPVLNELVAKHGPFDAFGGLFYMADRFPMRWDQRLLSPLLPHCKCFVGPGAGYDKVDIAWLTSRGAFYANSPRAVGRRTADGAFTLLLAALRGTTQQDLSVRSGKWYDRSVRTKNWRESTIGIIGLGNIGTLVAEMCAALGMSVIYTSRTPKPVPYEHVGLDELYARSDAIVLTCPLTPETSGMLDWRAFEKMKEGMIVVNVSRGEVIVEQDLLDALNSGKVLRAALDVFQNEPNVNPSIRAHPCITLSPHAAAAPDGMGRGINGEVIHNIIEYLRSGEPITPVNAKQLQAAGKLPFREQKLST